MVQDPRNTAFYLPHGPEAYGGAFPAVIGPKTTQAFHTVLKTEQGIRIFPEELSIKILHPQNFIDLHRKWDIHRLWLIDRIKGNDALVHIVDHRNLSGKNPLAGRTPIEDRPQFPDISHIYVKDDLGLSRCIVNTLGPGRFRGMATPDASEVCAHVALCAAYAGMEVAAIGWNRERDPTGRALNRFIVRILAEVAIRG